LATTREAKAAGARVALTRVLPLLVAGSVIGALEVVLAVSFAALIFGSTVPGDLPAGISLCLLSGIVYLTAISLGSSATGVIGSVQDGTAVIAAVMAASIVAEVPAQARFPTVVVSIGLATAASGLTFLVLGLRRLGNLVRFVPFPVVGGFLAGTGWLLVKGGVGVLAGRSVTLDSLDELIRWSSSSHWVVGVAFAIFLLVLGTRTQHPLAIPLAILGAGAAFYAIWFATGGSVSSAEDGGWLLGPLPSSKGMELWALSALGDADASALLARIPDILTIVVVGALALLLNVSGIELATDRRLDVNRELRVAGGANLAVGIAGGIPGFHALSLSGLARATGAVSRWVGPVAAAVCALALIGSSVLGFIPKLVIGGLVVFLGLGFMIDWTFRTARTMPRGEYAIVLVILATIVAVGLLQGVAVGVVVSVGLFIVRSSRTNVVKHELTGDVFPSNVDRPPEERRLLAEHGAGIWILVLQGTLFFGTAYALLERIERRAREGSPPLRFLVVDFRRVTDLDASAILSLQRAAHLAESLGFVLVRTGAVGWADSQLEFAFAHHTTGVVRFEDVDRGLEWCEERLLEEVAASGEGTEAAEAVIGPELMEQLRAYLAIARLIPASAGTRLERLISEGVVTPPSRPRQPSSTWGTPFTDVGLVDAVLEQRR
jgi:SulP family sulfate permease